MPETHSPPDVAHQILSATCITTAALREVGITRHHLAKLIEQGQLLRLRRGRFALHDTPPALVRVAALGGRLDCVSLLAAIGVFVRDRGNGLHVQLETGSSRLPTRPAGIVAHWRPSRSPCERLTTELIDALIQACRCQNPRDAIATLDSAWHHRLVEESDIAEIFARLPRRYRRLRGLLDPRAESGPETLVRLMLRSLGCHIDIQVEIVGLGRVDLLVNGWLIVECDSRAHHSDWNAQRRDRRRDLAAAALGYTTVRPIAEDILNSPDTVRSALRAALASPAPRPGLQNSFDRTITALEGL